MDTLIIIPRKYKREKPEGGGLEGIKRGRENERDLFFFSLLIKPATMRQEKQKLQFFATSIWKVTEKLS